jgi:hypothetical protein
MPSDKARTPGDWRPSLLLESVASVAVDSSAAPLNSEATEMRLPAADSSAVWMPLGLERGAHGHTAG